MGLTLFDSNIVMDALNGGDLLITRNKHDFRGSNIRLPYELQNGQIFNVAAPPHS